MRGIMKGMEQHHGAVGEARERDEPEEARMS